MTGKRMKLSDVEVGAAARVKEIATDGELKRRLLDMGLTERTHVKCLFRSAGGDPTAYMVRNTVVAIRREDAELITVTVLPKQPEEALPRSPSKCKNNIDKCPETRIIAIGGNPNVGKSTIFNGLTGMRQHTGNWPGKTVSNARGSYTQDGITYTLVDIPGTYSLMAHSAEEEVARDFICFGAPDLTVVVCDATCLERNLNLVLQTIEITDRVLVCINLMDEARRKCIEIDKNRLSQELGVPVVTLCARNKRELAEVQAAIAEYSRKGTEASALQVKYSPVIEEAISVVQESILPHVKNLPPRWLALRLLEGDESLEKSIATHLGTDLREIPQVSQAIAEAQALLCGVSDPSQADTGVLKDQLKDEIVSAIYKRAEEICDVCLSLGNPQYQKKRLKLDSILTGKITGSLIMLGLLAIIFWLTITGANYPSELLSNVLFRVQDYLMDFMHWLHAPDWLSGALVLGVYRTLAWVVSVMLPPMAIFFPLFTLLEDLGYLPRVAFNLDRHFKKCSACGKQGLSMCMGFGCNAVGVTGCRIIDSPRERLIAILTNNFVPCNGRFPTLIAIISMFFITSASGFGATVLSAAVLTLLILLGIAATFLSSAILSKTFLKGMPSAFTLELPPYRPPQVGKVIVRSVLDRTLYVLGRAVKVAAPAGLVIWLLANIHVGGANLLTHCSDFLDPLGSLMGLDGVILMAFILGFPANEIVIPIAIMAYTSAGTLTDFTSLTSLQELLTANGWTVTTALCTVLFSLMHWPCSTTLLTIRKETGSMKWTALAALLPTLFGFVTCCLVAFIGNLIF